MISVHFQGKQFNAPTSNAKEAEVEWFYEDLQDFSELTPPKDVLFIIGNWNTKVGDQWRNNSRKNGWSQSKTNTQLWM